MINNQKGSSVIGASLFSFLDIKCFSPVQTALAKSLLYNLQKGKEITMEEKFFTFTYNDHIYTVDLNSKKSREDCQARINHNTGKNSNGSRRVLVKRIGFYMTLRCTMYDAVVSQCCTAIYRQRL